MKKRSRHIKKKFTVRRSSKRNHTIPRWKVAGFTFLIFFLGVFWVWKENLHERLSVRFLALERQHRTLKAHSGVLRAELSNLTEFTRIEDLAHRKLNMISPRMPPDTIWCSEYPSQVMLGAALFNDFKPGE